MKKRTAGKFWLAAFCAALLSSGQFALGADHGEAAGIVNIEFVMLKVARGEEKADGRFQYAPFGLEFLFKLSVPPSWWLMGSSRSRKQYLEAADSAGRKLPPAAFGLGMSAFQYGENAPVQSYVSGEAGELPRPDVSWVRLKGAFRVPVARLQKSPVYELPLKNGADTPILLQEEGERECAEDVAVFRQDPKGSVFLKKYRVFEWKGRKMASVDISLSPGVVMQVDSLRVLNDRDEVLRVQSLGMRYSSGELGFTRYLERKLQFEYQEGMEKIGIQFRYIAQRDVVTVPVDVKVGMGGEIEGER